ncbi:hypothetical protein B0H16DRAFT_1568945 [Mycena metata]|uniref:Secreted protein n=1 Tax=Mycena metata TaxID=1033252 RepID=A0AAD7ID46_9AGAR|nr:hypothetical protein B0H16DRAFT_1568945 [Mycena metata]
MLARRRLGLAGFRACFGLLWFLRGGEGLAGDVEAGEGGGEETFGDEVVVRAERVVCGDAAVVRDEPGVDVAAKHLVMVLVVLKRGS